MNHIRLITFGSLSLTPFLLYASFIESTMGTAVVNDATAAYHNPAALVLRDKAQIVGLDSTGTSHSQFTGSSMNTAEGFTLSGSSKEHARFNLPSGYAAIPMSTTVKLGLALLSDNVNSDIDEPSILRYDQSNNRIRNMDYILGLGLQVNEYLSIGSGITYSDAHFASQRMIGFPKLELSDSLSNNITKADSYGWNAGILLTPFKATKIGFNYRSKVSYMFTGKSEFNGPSPMMSNSYHFNFWTPARFVASVSHQITPTLGFIGTVQWVQWRVFKSVTSHNIATQIGTEPTIIPTVVAPYHFKDSGVFTLGGIKKLSPQWILRVAGTYNQSPGNANYRITSGDDYIIGASMGYQISKSLTIDGGYAHAFTKEQHIDITSLRKHIIGNNKGYRDSVSLKLTYSLQPT